ncbi:MAG: sensor domain-containing protein [Acidimicrobiales bacterium]
MLSRAVANDALNFILGIVVTVVVITLVVLSAGFAITFVVGVPLAWFTFAATAALGSMERSQAAALLDVRLASPHRPLSAPTWLGRLRERAASASRWREIAYLSLMLPIFSMLGAILLSLWAAALLLIALPTFVRYLPDHSADFGFMRVHTGEDALVALAIGVVAFVLIVPQLTLANAALNRVVLRWFLGPSRRDDLARRVDELELSRGAAVDSAEAERHRIERDLHDGAQQRLVALAMNLGRAREGFDRDPERSRQLIVDAHEEAKAALVELRDLARGIHPAILTDRGLDAALSAVVARCPVPVSLSVDLPARPPATVESAAYFVVAEALTNVAKHAQATKARVVAALRDGRLVLEVSDNGIGGATQSAGGGLEGLASRVSALGGWLRVMSPPGGPTSVMVEFPCEW